ncbi:hypothetical protein [Pseudomonas aeruginosa]|uniref:hypothetical protein n=1 Tax=Pseudomonas aeruginosa TaxID=287 RepID=UPI0010675E09|nr:hypothetical protein [Pseudomonas aeruginosa]TEQ77820.1 hypothetical protein IPC50_03890 [Pseudomonas aeruginosa]
MSEIVNPSSSSSGAALQVVIELIRAGQLKVGVNDQEAAAIIATYDQIFEHFRELGRKPTRTLGG